MPVLEAVDLHKSFQGRDYAIDALRGVSFAVEPGEFVAVLGPSGCGKSTLLHLLGGLDQPTQGRVIIAEKDLSVLADDELTRFRRTSTGFVFQYLNLLPALNALENLSLPFLIAERTSSEDQDRATDLLELFGLRGLEQRLPSELSMGEQQRVAIARAFLTEPTIVVADELTGSVDPTTGREILQLLWESCDNFGQTILVTTHDPRVAVFADRVLFMRQGQLVDELPLGRREEHDDVAPIADRLQELSL